MIINHSGVSGSRTAYLLAAEIKEEKKNLLAVVSSGQAAARLADDLVFYMPGLNIIALPEEEDVQVLYEARDRGALVKRIQALAALSEAPAQGKHVMHQVILQKAHRQDCGSRSAEKDAVAFPANNCEAL